MSNNDDLSQKKLLNFPAIAAGRTEVVHDVLEELLTEFDHLLSKEESSPKRELRYPPSLWEKQHRELLKKEKKLPSTSLELVREQAFLLEEIQNRVNYYINELDFYLDTIIPEEKKRV